MPAKVRLSEEKTKSFLDFLEREFFDRLVTYHFKADRSNLFYRFLNADDAYRKVLGTNLVSKNGYQGNNGQ